MTEVTLMRPEERHQSCNSEFLQQLRGDLGTRSLWYDHTAPC